VFSYDKSINQGKISGTLLIGADETKFCQEKLEVSRHPDHCCRVPAILRFATNHLCYIMQIRFERTMGYRLTIFFLLLLRIGTIGASAQEVVFKRSFVLAPVSLRILLR